MNTEYISGMLGPSSIYTVCLAILLVLIASPTAEAWPETAYADIFMSARQILPADFGRFLEDMEPVLLEQPCAQTSVGAAAAVAIEQLSQPDGDLLEAVGAIRDAGCAAAAINDPGMNELVEEQSSKFAVVFYGWHPTIQDGDLARYLEIRTSELDALADRFERRSELPDQSDQVEVSPEFGMASIAYSHAVTDVANVWLYIWSSVNGAF